MIIIVDSSLFGVAAAPPVPAPQTTEENNRGKKLCVIKCFAPKAVDVSPRWPRPVAAALCSAAVPPVLLATLGAVAYEASHDVPTIIL